MTTQVDEQEWMETEEEKERKNLPEAPASMNIKFYIDGYGVQFTQRGQTLQPLVKEAIALVSYAKEHGWQPSWNSDTNKAVASLPVNPTLCPHTETVEKVSHTPKNNGRAFKSCTNCGKFIGWVYTAGFDNA